MADEKPETALERMTRVVSLQLRAVGGRVFTAVSTPKRNRPAKSVTLKIKGSGLKRGGSHKAASAMVE